MVAVLLLLCLSRKPELFLVSRTDALWPDVQYSIYHSFSDIQSPSLPSLSSAPKVYASKPQLKRPAPAVEEEKPVAPTISSTEQPPAFSAIPDKKSKAAAMAEKVASSATTVVEGGSTEGGSGSSGGKGGGKVDGGPGGSGQKPQGTNRQEGKQKPPKKPKKFIRTAGGQVWEDRSLHDWDKGKWRRTES